MREIGAWGAESRDAPSLAPGTTLAGYQIDQRIGAGGIAEVYAAKDTYSEREVALKTLRAKYCSLPEFVERMRREAIVTTQLRHRNIVMCWAAGLTHRRPWLALERLHGATLRQSLQERPLWPHDVLSIMRQAAHALDAAHRHGIVHRDIKPENLFIERQRLVLLDFGFAKIECNGPATDPFVMPGTIAYMAPEQILHKPPDARTDLYALGICAYEALAGRHPFVNERDVWPSDDVMAQFHLEDPPYPLTELVEGFPPGIWSIVERCLSKNPSKRYPDANAMAVDLSEQERKLTVAYPRSRFEDPSELSHLWSKTMASNQSGQTRADASKASAHANLETRTKSRLLDTIFDAPSSLTGEHEVEIRHIGPDQCLVWYGNVQAILSLEPPTYEFMKKIVSELELLAKKCSCGTGALLVIRSDVSPPSEEARAYIKYELSRSSMLAAAQVVEGTGFQGAAMRSVLTMLQLASGVRYPMKIFDRLNDGAHWLASELKKRAGQAPDPAGLLRAVLTVRQRFLTQRRPPSLVTGRLYQSGS